MGNLALREYHRKIENLIEIHQIEDALSHCANIIHKYPKEIETYRKLGKIFLEKQDLILSQKIFDVILSVFPDDFVANVGLSYIHEHVGGMDKAIDHMLMAFELQPANPSLQDELKRLYNKRDNTEPNKIRLTRGALIKMYARSSLYEQAIGEIKLGLYEKPNRIDFKLVLAEMLWKSDMHIEAVETAVDVVSQLPYCWKANEILDKAFQDLHEGQTENNYRARLVELDPYYRYMLPATRSVADIPDIAESMEDEPDRANEIEDWQDFLSQTWTVASLPVNEEASSSDLNWEAILEEAGEEEKEDESAKSAASLALFDELSKNRDIETPLNSRRQSFIERLQQRSQADQVGQPAIEESAVMKGPTPPEQAQVEPEIPAETPAEAEGGISSIAEQPQPENEVSSDSGEPIEQTVSAEAAAEADAQPESMPEAGQPEAAHPTDALADMDLPGIPDESGIIDHDVPVEIPLSDEAEPSSAQWISDNDILNPGQPAAAQPTLQDTQQIQIALPTPAERLQQARGMIENGSIPFALRYIRDLAEDDHNLESIRELLENACEKSPQESNLWLALGNIYQRLNQKEKALEVFTRAQKNISL